MQSVDALRGLIMIVMALDHVRDFVHSGAMQFSPDDLRRTTTALFFTRWITHFCAPVFMFTAGLGAYFWLARGRTKPQLSRFLWTRGLWLVVLELTVLRLAIYFSYFEGMVLLSVLWALGWSMVALAALCRLPIRVLAPLSVAVIALHNLTDRIPAARFGGYAGIWNVLHQPGVFPVDGVMVLAAYPLIPWIFVMAAGYCFGAVMVRSAAERQRWMVYVGLAMTAAFVVIRAINVYGDPQPWTTRFPGMTALSFLRVTKYPPSLDFLLMTLGPALLLLAWLDRRSFSRSNPLIVFGRVPLFYFLVHMFLAHALMALLSWIRYGHVGFMFGPSPSLGGAASRFPAGFGYSLGVVYAVWITVVLLMYPLCRWFAAVKERRRDWWLSYL